MFLNSKSSHVTALLWGLIRQEQKCFTNESAVCKNCGEEKPHQDSKSTQSHMFDNKAPESLSVAVRNACHSECVVFKWLVADMTVH